jgi:hypothetical protein
VKRDNMKIRIEYARDVWMDVNYVTMVENVTLVLLNITSRLEKILAKRFNAMLKTAKCVKMQLLKTKFAKYALQDSS